MICRAIHFFSGSSSTIAKRISRGIVIFLFPLINSLTSEIFLSIIWANCFWVIPLLVSSCWRSSPGCWRPVMGKYPHTYKIIQFYETVNFLYIKKQQKQDHFSSSMKQWILSLFFALYLYYFLLFFFFLSYSFLSLFFIIHQFYEWVNFSLFQTISLLFSIFH